MKPNYSLPLEAQRSRHQRLNDKIEVVRAGREQNVGCKILSIFLLSLLAQAVLLPKPWDMIQVVESEAGVCPHFAVRWRRTDRLSLPLCKVVGLHGLMATVVP